MKILSFVIVILVIVSFNAYSQLEGGIFKPHYEKKSVFGMNYPYSKNKDFIDRFVYTIGVSAGHETVISAPRMGAIFAIPFDNRQEFGSGDATLGKSSFYAGTEVSMFVFFAGTFAISGNVGFKIGPVTIDNSITHTVVVGPSNESYNYTSINPKIGLKLGPVWIKAGPCYKLRGDFDIGKWVEVANIPFNFDLLYVTDFKYKKKYYRGR